MNLKVKNNSFNMNGSNISEHIVFIGSQGFLKTNVNTETSIANQFGCYKRGQFHKLLRNIELGYYLSGVFTPFVNAHSIKPKGKLGHLDKGTFYLFEESKKYRNSDGFNFGYMKNKLFIPINIPDEINFTLKCKRQVGRKLNPNEELTTTDYHDQL
uniref:Restriction endonuclease subunit S n=1 Tax=Rhabditophanes sp. KR3021 TaxID=114890 RepID=A0AC35TU97_9BILA